MQRNDINNEIIALWEDYSDVLPELTSRWPMLYPSLQEKSILFIGLNPSFTSYIEPSDYQWHPRQKDSERMKTMRKIIDAEKKAVKDHKDGYKPYFSPIWTMMDKISENKSEIEWEHIDLFLLRETSSKKLEKDFKEVIRTNSNVSGKLELLSAKRNFYRQQIEITAKIIRSLGPRLIITNNNLVSDILSEKRYSDLFSNIFRYEQYLQGSSLITSRILSQGAPIHYKKCLTEKVRQLLD